MDTKYIVLERTAEGSDKPCYEVWQEDSNGEPDYENLRNSAPSHPVVFMDKYDIAQAITEWDEGLDENDPDYASNLYDIRQRTIKRHVGTIGIGIPVGMGIFPPFMGLPTGMSGIPSFMGLAIGRLIERILDDDDVDNDDGFKDTASLWGAKKILEVVENLEKLFAYKATISARKKRAIDSNAAEIIKTKAEYEKLLSDELGGITLKKYKEAVCIRCCRGFEDCPTLKVLDEAEARMKILFPEG